MSQRDLYHNLSPQHSITNAIVPGNATTTTGSKVDMNGYKAALCLFEVGAPGDVLSGALSMSLQVKDSPDDITYTTVPAASLLGGTGVAGEVALLDGSAGNNGSKCYAASYIGAQRYLKLLIVRTGNNAVGSPVAGSVVLGAPIDAPAAVPG